MLSNTIIAFIVEPLSFPLAECWEIQFPEVAEFSNDEFFRQNKGMAKKFLLVEENKKWLNYYLFRAHKMVQALCVTHNMRCVLAYSENFLDSFFKSVEQELQQLNTEERLYNVNLLAELILQIVKLEPYAGYNYMLFYNIPFLFMRFIDRSIVFDVFAAITLPSNLFAESTEDMANKFWNYFKQSDFFTDLFSILTKNPVNDPRKLKVSYKPIRIPEMSKLMIGGMQQMTKTKLRGTHSGRLTISSTQGIMVEDQKFIAADIDLVKKYQKEAKAKIVEMSLAMIDSDMPNKPKVKQLVRTGTLDLVPDENLIVNYIKGNVPINARYSIVVTSPEKLAAIEPFKQKKLEDTSSPKFDGGSSTKTIKSRNSRTRMSV